MALAGTYATFPRKRLMQNLPCARFRRWAAAGCWPERRRAGLPWRRLQVGSVNRVVPREVELIGVPTNSSGTVDGVARAPAVLRQRGLSAALAGRPGFTDAGDLALPAPQSRRGPSGLLAEDALITMIGRVAGAVRAARGRGRFPVVLGGDCPVMLGALAALQAEQDQPGLLFVDGHEDAWPPLASPTGEAADCELGLVLGLFDAVLDQRLCGVLPRIRAADVIAIGPHDHDELAAAGVPTLTGQLRALIRPAGVHAGTGAAAAAALPAPWWVHTDLDVLASTASQGRRSGRSSIVASEGVKHAQRPPRACHTADVHQRRSARPPAR
jgi:arginase